MNQNLNIREGASCSISRSRNILESVSLKGVFETEIWKRRKSGTLYLKERLIIENTIVVEAKAAMFNAMFNAGSQVPQANWSIGLVNNAGFSSFGANDTMTSHGWTELVSYSQTTRPAWGQATTATNSISNASPAVFNMTSPAVVVKGLFVTSDNAKNGTSGLLWSAAAYTTPPSVDNGDEIRSVYSLTM